MHVYHHHIVHLCTCSRHEAAGRRSDASSSSAPRKSTSRSLLGALLELAQLAAISATGAVKSDDKSASRGDVPSMPIGHQSTSSAVSRDDRAVPDAAPTEENALIALFSQSAPRLDTDKPEPSMPSVSMMDAIFAAFRDAPTSA